MVSLGGLARKIFGSSNDRRVRGYRPRVDAINALEPQMKALSATKHSLPRPLNFASSSPKARRWTIFWCRPLPLSAKPRAGLWACAPSTSS